MKAVRFVILVFVCASLVASATAMAAADPGDSAGALYSKSVDLANAGRYTEALEAADAALALNVSSLIPLIQANRAGILVVLHRYGEAVTAADAALAVEGNLTTVHSIAWYNKGDALKGLGRCDEAAAAFVQAARLDPSLVPPDPAACTTPLPTTPARSPVPWFATPASLGLLLVLLPALRTRSS